MAVFFLLFLLFLPIGQNNASLFPERIAFQERAAQVMKQIRLTDPALSKVRFLWSAGNSGSALLELCFLAAADEFFSLCKETTADQGIKNKFRAWRKAGYEKKRAAVISGFTDLSLLELQILNISTMAEDFKTNTLSSNDALFFWELFIGIIEKSAKKRPGEASEAALLALGSRLQFLRAARNWRGKALRFTRRQGIPDDTPLSARQILSEFKKMAN